MRAWVALALVALTIVAACGPATPETPISPAGPAPTVTVPFEMPIAIALAGHFDEQFLDLLDEQIAIFEEDNADVKVAIIAAPEEGAERRQQFADQLARDDTRIDIYLLDTTWLSEFAANGWLAALDEYVKLSDVRMANLTPATVQAHTVDGRLVALPAPCLDGQSLTLSTHSLHPDQAFRFMAFLVSDGLQSLCSDRDE